MNYALIVIMGFSILLPALTGILRIKKSDTMYLPFLLCIWAGLINEVINLAFINILHVSNSVNTDIYCLAEALLYTWLFRNFNLFKNRKAYILLLAFFCIAWITENIIISNMAAFNSYFTIIYSLAIVFMSITILNRLIVTQVSLVTNPVFLICTGLVIYFSISALTEIFWLYGLNYSGSFRLNIYRIMAYINLTVNLIFTLAFLWMHRKQEFTPQQ